MLSTETIVIPAFNNVTCVSRREMMAVPSTEAEAAQRLAAATSSNASGAVSVPSSRARTSSARRAKESAASSADGVSGRELDSSEAEAERQKLARTLEKTHSGLKKKLANLESNISELEEDYISCTWTHGNVIRGWDGFIPIRRADRPNKNAGNGSGSATGAPKHRKPRYTDRIFSLSSASSQIRKDNADSNGVKKSNNQKKKKKR